MAGQLALAHDALLPQPPGGNAPGALLALLVHAGLIVALTVAVDWRSKTPEPVSAELWASLPQTAAARTEAVAVAPAPPPPQPAPAPPSTPAPPPAPRAAPPAPPREADIAVEREQRRKADAARLKAEAAAEQERKRVEAQRQQADASRKKREQDEREAQAEDARLARQRQEYLKRMMVQANAATSTAGSSNGTAAQAGAPSAAYSARVAKLIRDASVFTGSLPGNPAAEVLVRAGPSGTILSRTLVKSSGFKPWDDAVLQAIDKVGSLPRDSDGRVPPVMTIIFRPNE